MTSIAVTSGDSGGSVGRSYRPRYRSTYRRRRSYRYRRPYRRRYRRRRLTAKQREAAIDKALKPLQMSKFELANLDPFDQNCYGARIPDSNTYPSTALRAEDEVSMSTDAVNGVVTAAFRPFLVSTRVDATAAGASNWTWAAAYGGGSDSAKRASIAANYAHYRPVAHGIRLSAPTAPTSTTGFVHIAIYAENLRGATWSYPQSVQDMNNCMYYARYPLALLTQKCITVVNKFLDCSSTLYLDPTGLAQASQDSNLVLQTERGWATIIVAVEGAPINTKVLTVELVTHLECTTLFSGVNTAMPAAPYNVSQLENVSRVAGHAPGTFIEGERGSYFQEALSSARQGISDAFQEFISENAYIGGRHATAFALGGIMGVTNNRLPSSRFGGVLRNPLIT